MTDDRAKAEARAREWLDDVGRYPVAYTSSYQMMVREMLADLILSIWEEREAEVKRVVEDEMSSWPNLRGRLLRRLGLEK